MTSHMEQKLKLTHRWTKTPHFKQTSYASSHAIFLACYPGGKWLGFKEARWAGIASLGILARKQGPWRKSEKLAQQDAERLGWELLLDIQSSTKQLMDVHGVEVE